MDFLRDALTIDTTSPNPTSAPPGVTLDPTPASSPSRQHGHGERPGHPRRRPAPSGRGRTHPPAAGHQQEPPPLTANPSASTFLVYDPLARPSRPTSAMVLSEKSSTGTTWRYYFESADDTDSPPDTGLGPCPLRHRRAARRPRARHRQHRSHGTARASPLTSMSSSRARRTASPPSPRPSGIAATFRDGRSLAPSPPSRSGRTASSRAPSATG